MGEKLTDLEVFHPERMASRILGMGDMLSLIEKAEQALDEKKAIELEQKMRNSTFTYNDFLDQMEQMKKKRLCAHWNRRNLTTFASVRRYKLKQMV